MQWDIPWTELKQACCIAPQLLTEAGNRCQSWNQHQNISTTYPEPVHILVMSCELTKHAMCGERGCDDWVRSLCSFSAWGVSDFPWSKAHPKWINSEFKHGKMGILIKIDTETTEQKTEHKDTKWNILWKDTVVFCNFSFFSLSFYDFPQLII